MDYSVPHFDGLAISFRFIVSRSVQSMGVDAVASVAEYQENRRGLIGILSRTITGQLVPRRPSPVPVAGTVARISSATLGLRQHIRRSRWAVRSHPARL